MKLTKELMEKAKTAKTAAELAGMAKTEGMELTPEDAAELFAKLHHTGELADEELDQVAGGCADPSPDGGADNEMGVEYLYDVGKRVDVIRGFGTTKTGVITKRYPVKYDTCYFPKYTVQYEKDGKIVNVYQYEIALK